MAVTSSLGAYGGQNLMLMRNDNSADTLVAMLGSCSPHMSLQQVSRSMGVLDDVSGGGGGQKRPYYAAYNDGPSVEEPEDVDEGADEFSHHVEKKRRLSFDQVRSLERNFEVENKLEPERKMQLAKELGLQPRQVAVWFQNRRARWKIKQLERDYEALTQDYNRLKSDLEAVNRDKSKLKAEVNRLKGVTTTTEDVKAVESTQCRSNTTSHPASPTHSDRSDIDSSRHSSRALPTIDVPTAAATKEGSSQAGMQRSMSYDSNSSDIMDADSPRTSDNSSSRNKNNNINNNIINNNNSNNTTSSSHQAQPEQLADVDGPWSQYPSLPPENFVSPNLQELCSVPSEQDLALSLHAFHRAGVKLEDMPSGFSGDQAFLLSRLEEQSVLPNWWEWA